MSETTEPIMSNIMTPIMVPIVDIPDDTDNSIVFTDRDDSVFTDRVNITFEDRP